MKKIFFIGVLILFSNAHAMSSGPGGGWGMEIDRESLGVGGSGKFPTEILTGSGFGGLTSLGSGGISGMEISRDLSIPNERIFRMNEYSREIGSGGF